MRLPLLTSTCNGKPDSEIAGVCQREKRVLVTLDLDFADLTKYPPREYAGLLVIRIANQHKAGVLAVLDRILPLLASEVVDGKIWIVDERRVRVREA